MMSAIATLSTPLPLVPMSFNTQEGVVGGMQKFLFWYMEIWVQYLIKVEPLVLAIKKG